MGKRKIQFSRRWNPLLPTLALEAVGKMDRTEPGSISKRRFGLVP